jgi:hypothetical protein
MSDAKRAERISFDEVTEAAVGGVLRALEVHRKTLLETEKIIFKNPPIIYGIWIMPDLMDMQQIQDVTRRVNK